MTQPDIFEKDGKIWVDTGHADVGPFIDRAEAERHIERMRTDSEKRAEEQGSQPDNPWTEIGTVDQSGLQLPIDDNKTYSSDIAEELWDKWLKENLSTGEYDLHVSGVQTLVKTHEDSVVELIKKQGDETVSLGYYRLKVDDK